MNIAIPASAYLYTETDPMLPEERLQKYELPVEIAATESCRVARLSNANNDHLDIGVSVTTENQVSSVSLAVTGEIGGSAVDQITIGPANVSWEM